MTLRQLVPIGVVIAIVSAIPPSVRAQAPAPTPTSTPTSTPSADALFADVTAKESAVRKALAVGTPQPTLLKAVRTVIADFENVVRRYPASGYSDDSLWRGAILSRDAFTKFHDAHEHATAVRLLKSLQARYPTSRFAKTAAAELTALNALQPRSSVTTVPSTTAVTSEAPSPVAAAAAPQPAPQPTTVLATAPAAPAKVATISAIRRAVLANGIRIVIELDGEVTFHDERLENPARVFVDLPSTRAAAPLVDQTLRFDGDADLVRQVRIGRHPKETTRIVLETAGISSYSVYPLYSPFRLIIDCLRASPDDAGAATRPPAPPTVARAPTVVPPPLHARRLPTVQVPSPVKPDLWPPLEARRKPLPAAIVPVVSPTAAAALREATPAISKPVTAAVAKVETPQTPIGSVSVAQLPAPPIGEPSRNLAGGLSIARQLGLGVSRIVIDPGHGGHDPGAKAAGTSEAELVLDIALKLEAQLAKLPGIEVVLTRRTDEFVPLAERTAIANRENADLFLSIHANASNVATVRGVETYFLNFASNMTAAAVAARENAASGQAMNQLPDVIKAIALNNKRDESRDFATYVQREMVGKLRPANKLLKDLGVKQAPFVVLIGAAMPSALAEVSFLTNPQDARLLKSSQYRQRIANALFDAVRKYQTALKNAPSLVGQQ